MTDVDHYLVLGISESATATEVNRAYRSLMRQYHPDYNPDPDVAPLLLRVAEAHRVLSRHELRADYDSRRSKTRAARLVSTNGAHVQLGALLGAGLRSRVYRVMGSPGIVCKIYEGGATPAKHANLVKLLDIDLRRTTRLRDSGQIVPTLAWPEELVFADDRVQGYLMGELPAGAVTFTDLIRQEGTPSWVDQLDLFLLLHIGMNLALLLDQVHDANVVVGDLNPMHVHVAPSLVVTFSGCDSFVAPNSSRAQQHYTSGYAAPEVGGGAAFTHESDRFVLAVLLHELFTGRHPFRPGRVTRDISGAALRSLRDTIQLALRLGVHTPHARPTPREWISVLQECAHALRPREPRSERGGASGNARLHG